MLEPLLTSLKEAASQNFLSNAFQTFSLILRQQSRHGCSSDCLLQSLASLFACCSQVKAISEGKQLHAYAICLGFDKSPVLVPKLVTFYSVFNILNEAHVVTASSNIIQPLPWNLLISSYVKAGFYKDGLSAYREMVGKGIRPDNFTYPSVLKACGEEFDLGFGMEIHKLIVEADLGWNLFVHNALMSMYSKCGRLDVARELFDKMPERDGVSWNSIISGYASKGMWGEAFVLFERMRRESVEVDIIIWNTIAGGYLKTGKYMGALKLLCRMRTSGIEWDPVAMIIGITACSQTNALKLGKEVHGLAYRTCCHAYDNVKHALITMYSRCKDLRHAHFVFESVESKHVITWNSIISGFTLWDRSEEASFLFREMLLSGTEPNYVTIASILPLCARVANLQHGKEFHCYITRREEFKDYLLLWNSLIDMYARSGKISLARRLFDTLTKKDEVTYTSLIAGYGIQGEGNVGVELFEVMLQSKIKPDHITMIAVLSACSHSGLVAQGRTLFEKMFPVYGIVPRLEHFACMVDLYGRAGLLVEAQETIRRMPYQPTPAMWATIIGACRIHGNTKLGEWAAEKLLEMQPQNSGYYVLVANMYAASGCWHKLAKVRTSMRDSGVSKDPGCTWLDVGAGFTPFLVADTSSSKALEIYPLLGGLNKQLKEADNFTPEEEEEILQLCPNLTIAV